MAAQNPTVGDTQVVYDALGRPVKKTETGGTKTDGSGGVQVLTTTYVHDADGRTTGTTDPNGKTTTATLDQLGQATVLSRPDGTDSATYDKAGHTIQTANGNGHTVYTYDALWRVILEKHYDATNVLISTTSHAYDAAGNELQPITTLADGTQTGVTYTYDALGRIATVSDNARTYAYDANGQVGSVTVYSDPAKTNLAYQASYGYDAATRTSTLKDLVGPTATQLHNYTYGYDPANNITSVTDAIGGASQSYTYDNLNELTKVTDSTGTTSFSYDANHNRKTMVATVGTSSFTTSYTYDLQADAELLAKTDPSNKVTQYTYDTAGNLTSATYDPTPGANQVTTYAYDTQGRLISVNTPDGTANGTTISYTYDADGNRASKTVTTGGPASTTTTVRDVYQAGRIAYQTDGNGTTLATFTYDVEGEPASVLVGSDPSTAPRYFYVYNQHGDVVALTDASGNTAATYSYDVFGGVTATEAFASSWTNPYRYDGKDRVRYDGETSFYWMSVRAYDPTLGRFLSRDPLSRTPLVWATQPYVYGGNNPLRYADPSGQVIVDADGDQATALVAPRTSVQTKPGGPPNGCAKAPDPVKCAFPPVLCVKPSCLLPPPPATPLPGTDGRSGCYATCGGTDPSLGPTGCTVVACEVGNSKFFGLLSLVGHSNTALMAIGEEGRKTLLDLVREISDKSTQYLATIGTVATGAGAVVGGGIGGIFVAGYYALAYLALQQNLTDVETKLRETLLLVAQQYPGVAITLHETLVPAGIGIETWGALYLTWVA